MYNMVFKEILYNKHNIDMNHTDDFMVVRECMYIFTGLAFKGALFLHIIKTGLVYVLNAILEVVYNYIHCFIKRTLSTYLSCCICQRASELRQRFLSF